MKPGLHQAGTDDQNGSAFTLMEVVVVIATVALLAVILLPAHAHTAANSQIFQCMNNNRQIGIAVQMYAADNRDYLPHPNWRAPGGDRYQGWLYNPTNAYPPNMTAAPYDTNPQLAYEGGQIWQYVKNIKSYWCPTDNTNNFGGLYWSWRLNKQSTYVWNGAVNSYGDFSGRTYQLSRFNPAAYLQWEPDEWIYYAGRTNTTQPPINANCYNDGAMDPSGGSGLGKRHGKKGGNLLGFDGRVDIIRYETFYGIALQKHPGLLWCDPGKINGGP